MCGVMRDSSLTTVIFTMMAMLNIIINLDGGGVPAALINIQQTFNLSATQLGLLGALVYLGQASGAVVFGPLLKKYSASRVCMLSLWTNTAMTALFGASSSTGMLLTTRFLIGFLQAAPAVYFPVWVDEFGPEKSRTVWMAIIQAGAPLGIMCGYVFAGVMTEDDESDTFAWRVPFFAQSAVLVGFSLAAVVMPRALFDLPRARYATSPAAAAADAPHAAMVSTPSFGSGLAPAADPSSHGGSADVEADDEPAIEEAEEPSGDVSSDGTALPKPSKVKPKRGHRRTGSGEPLMTANALAAAEAEERADADAAPKLELVAEASFNAERGQQSPGARSPGTAVSPGCRHVSIDLAQPPASPTVLPGELLPGELVAEAIAGLVTRVPHGSQVDQQSVTGRERLQSGEVVMEAISGLVMDPDVDEAAEAARESSGASSAPAKPLSARAAMRQLLASRIYVLTVFALSALFFVVTGIQFWVTAYLVDVLGAPKDAVVMTFAIVSISMPILGVVVGSMIVDKLGGYAGARGVARTLTVCAVFGWLAACAAFATCFVAPGGHAFATVVSLICVTLFFGGCIVPSATGVIMEIAAPEARPVASAGSVIIFQVFGYALSPLVSAIVMEIGGGGGARAEEEAPLIINATTAMMNLTGVENPADESISMTPAQLQLGFRTVMAWGLFAAIGLTLASRAAKDALREKFASRTIVPSLAVGRSLPLAPPRASGPRHM